MNETRITSAQAIAEALSAELGYQVRAEWVRNNARDFGGRNVGQRYLFPGDWREVVLGKKKETTQPSVAQERTMAVLQGGGRKRASIPSHLRMSKRKR